MTTPNPTTSADGGWRVLFAFLAQWPAAAEFCRWPQYAMRITTLLLLLVLAAGCATPADRKGQAAASPAAERSPSISVVVGGEVQHAGEYSFPAGTCLSDAINGAGGFSVWAAKHAVRVRHKDGSLHQYNLKRPGQRGWDGGIVLRDRDTVFVPRLLS